MSDDESLESFVNEAELRALLGDEGELETPVSAPRIPEAPATSPKGLTASAPSTAFSEMAIPPRVTADGLAVILASRRRADAALLSERLAAAGFRVDVARNPFRVLDLLRARAYSAVLTDFCLWVDGAKLLFERIEGMAQPPLVVLLSDRHTAPENRPRKAGVAGELLCPLSPLEVEVAVEQLIAATTDRDAVDPTEERKDLIGDDRAIGRSGPRNDAAIGSGESRDALLASRSALDLGPYRWEIPWLRFFLEAQRRLRTGDGRDALFSALVTLGREVLGADAAGIALVNHGELTAHVNAPSAAAGTPGGSEHRSWLREISGFLESPADDSRPSWDGPSVFSLDVPFSPGSDGDAALPRTSEESICRFVLLGLSRPIRSAALTFREDLRALVIEVLKRP